MITILINGNKAVLKKNTSFEFVSENPMFTDADQYSFNIQFPLKDCPDNLRIFGFFNRPGARIKNLILDMQIIAGAFSVKGAGIITGFSETECTVQFLGNRSALNYYSDLDQIFVNSLELGSVPSNYLKAQNVDVATAWAGHSGNMDMVAIPWVNESTGNIQNDTAINPEYVAGMDFRIGDDQMWKLPEDAEDMENYSMGLSWMPYLYDIAVKICNAIGFSFDFSAWRGSKWYHLLLCNAVPSTWNQDWNMLLPHWSVIEFFRKLEPLLEGTFVFNIIGKRISFVTYAKALNDAGITAIDNVLDSFTSDTFDDEQQCKLISQRYMGYASGDSKVGKLYSCAWFVRDFCKKDSSAVLSFETAADLSNKAHAQNWRDYMSLDKFYPRRNIFAFYIRQDDRFITDRVSLNYFYKHLPWGAKLEYSRVARIPALLNNFGPRCMPEDRHEADSLDLTLEVVPAIIDETKNRRMIFISVGELEDNRSEPMYEDYSDKNVTYDVYDSLAMQILDRGEDDGSKAYFSNLAVGFYPGASSCLRKPPTLVNNEDYNAEIIPIIDNLEFDVFWNPWRPTNKDYTLSLLDSQGKFKGIPKVDPDVKFEYSFIADSLPDVNSIFHVRGHRYLCEKLTANFSADGMSQKIKGTFWRII